MYIYTNNIPTGILYGYNINNNRMDGVYIRNRKYKKDKLFADCTSIEPENRLGIIKYIMLLQHIHLNAYNKYPYRAYYSTDRSYKVNCFQKGSSKEYINFV